MVHAQVEVANVCQRAPSTFGRARLAGLPAMTDHVQMEWVERFQPLSQSRFKYLMRRIGACAGPDSARTPHDPQNMRIDGHGRHPETEKQHTGRGLHPD